MVSEWEIYRGGETKPRNKSFAITINRDFVLKMNRYARGMLGNPDAVLLMFDRAENVIGVAPTPAADPDGFKIKVKGEISYVVHTAPFCRHHGIFFESTEQFAMPGLTREGYLTLDLKNTRVVSRRKKPRL